MNGVNGARGTPARRYIAYSDAFIVPAMHGMDGVDVSSIHEYGKRAWCRLEAFAAFTWALLTGRRALFANDPSQSSKLRPINFQFGEDVRASKGVLFSEADREAITAHEKARDRSPRVAAVSSRCCRWSRPCTTRL